eukprot:scaffold234184_cov37-Tisochrysis_lutea.AAC.5
MPEVTGRHNLAGRKVIGVRRPTRLALARCTRERPAGRRGGFVRHSTATTASSPRLKCDAPISLHSSDF